MGYYINQNSKGEPLPASGKVKALIDDGAELVERELIGYFQPNLVCVVDNGMFEAAGHAYSEDEMKAFSSPHDDRQKTWLTYDHAEKLAQ